ncbi:MAG TPA: cell division protein FtsA [Thermoanaerobaculia bacterium]|nr:cell division protein FtsA [Thermoanaerobaculia bacterium]HQP87928.1 cell division protein FtsA [Thermoanaerobaculia bacterium]
MPKTSPYLVSLDIGSSKVCALIAETGSEGRVDVVGKGIATHKGTRKGAIIDVPATIEAIKRATEEAEIMAGVQIERAVVGVAGPVVRSFNSRQVVAVAARNREISRDDIDRALDAARSCPIPSDYEILAVLQRQFVVDGQDGVADPLGMVGSRLEADVHVVTVPVATTQNLLKCVNGAGVAVTEMVLEPLAASEAVLTPDEKDHGVVLADIGGGTTEIAVWRQGALAHTAVIPIGGDLFTSDLAVLLKTPVPDAERLKKKYGAAVAGLSPAEETVDVPRTGGREVHPVARSYMAEILEARARELFEVLWREATADIPPQELRAGLVLTGGGAALDGMTDEAEQVLGVPVRIGTPRGLGGLVDVINGPEWACVAGLLLVGRGGAASPKGRPAAPAGLLSKLKNSLGKMFAPASAI